MPKTVLVTGITGFVAKQVALNLLNEGYVVRGTLRALARADEVRQALHNHGADLSELTFYETNLGEDRGWQAAVDGCDYIQHIASPVPISQPRDRDALVPLARGGTLRVLNAARVAGVKQVVVTSSIAAMALGDNQLTTRSISENDWSNPESKYATAYIVAKTRAELAVWDWAKENNWTRRVTTVNPSYVMGPTLDAYAGSSIRIIQMMMTGAFLFLPPANFMLADIRDIAELHVRAMTLPSTRGRRLLGAADTLQMAEIANIVREAFPAYAAKIPKRTLPASVVRLLARFNGTLRSIVPSLGTFVTADNGYVTELTGVSFRPAAEAVRATGQSLIDYGLV